MIRRGDENISALEVEKVVESHPDIKECAAVAAYLRSMGRGGQAGQWSARREAQWTLLS